MGICTWRPPNNWMIQNGYMRCPARRGWPAMANIAFQPTSAALPFTPRKPWVYETESRAAGTGLVMGCMPCRQVVRHRPYLV